MGYRERLVKLLGAGTVELVDKKTESVRKKFKERRMAGKKEEDRKTVEPIDSSMESLKESTDRQFDQEAAEIVNAATLEDFEKAQTSNYKSLIEGEDFPAFRAILNKKVLYKNVLAELANKDPETFKQALEKAREVKETSKEVKTWEQIDQTLVETRTVFSEILGVSATEIESIENMDNEQRRKEEIRRIVYKSHFNDIKKKITNPDFYVKEAPRFLWKALISGKQKLQEVFESSQIGQKTSESRRFFKELSKEDLGEVFDYVRQPHVIREIPTLYQALKHGREADVSRVSKFLVDEGNYDQLPKKVRDEILKMALGKLVRDKDVRRDLHENETDLGNEKRLSRFDLAREYLKTVRKRNGELLQNVERSAGLKFQIKLVELDKILFDPKVIKKLSSL